MAYYISKILSRFNPPEVVSDWQLKQETFYIN